MEKCMMCSKSSHGRKLCYSCSTKKSNLYSVIKQNSKKLSKLIDGKWYTPDGFKKFDRYVDNINRCKLELIKFLEKDDCKRFGVGID